MQHGARAKRAIATPSRRADKPRWDKRPKPSMSPISPGENCPTHMLSHSSGPALSPLPTDQLRASSLSSEPCPTVTTRARTTELMFCIDYRYRPHRSQWVPPWAHVIHVSAEDPKDIPDPTQDHPATCTCPVPAHLYSRRLRSPSAAPAVEQLTDDETVTHHMPFHVSLVTQHEVLHVHRHLRPHPPVATHRPCIPERAHRGHGTELSTFEYQSKHTKPAPCADADRDLEAD